MKKLLLLLLFLVTSAASSQDLTPDNQTSRVGFEIKNFGVTVAGTFSGLTGRVQFDPARLESSMFNLSVQASTIETGISLRNKHLKKEDFLDVETHPELRISSVSISQNSSGAYIFTGNLSIKGVKREISFPFTILPTSDGYDFVGMFTINRLDFGVGGNSFSLSDNVLVKFQIRALKRLP